MKRSLIIASIAVLSALLLASCGSEETSADTAASSGETTAAENVETIALYASADGAFEDGDLYFSPDGVNSLKPDDDTADFKAAFGEPITYTEAPSCNYDGNDTVCEYAGFNIYTYPDGETDRVSIIELTDGSVATNKGVKVGDTEDVMTEKYGDVFMKTGYLWSYNATGGTLSFTIEEGLITLIEYVSYN